MSKTEITIIHMPGLSDFGLEKISQEVGAKLKEFGIFPVFTTKKWETIPYQEFKKIVFELNRTLKEFESNV